jgi:hypothetical protein
MIIGHETTGQMNMGWLSATVWRAGVTIMKQRTLSVFRDSLPNALPLLIDLHSPFDLRYVSRLQDRPLQTQCFRREQKCPLAPVQPSLLVSQPTFPKQEPSFGDPRLLSRYGSWRYTDLPVGVVKAASVNAPKAAVKTE